MEFRKKERPFVIAGPCSAETEDQLFSTVEKLKDLPVDLIRAGVWKPRTRPGNFEGVGSDGLKWLVEAGRSIGKPVTIEVANPDHVEQALKHKIDVLWVGARTTVNPFTIQEIANSLKGVDIPILVKNPVNPDIELWIGAIERFQNAGMTNVGAVHRGFSTFQKSPFRNSPNWNIPIELKRRMPDLPIICDPSHICGSRALLEEVSQKSIDLNMDGLMVETHIEPAKAWSDADQQITPDALNKLLARLVWRKPNSQDLQVKARLEELRANIDALDRDILDMLIERLELSKQIGAYKKEHSITILQHQRWNEILHDRSSYIEGKDLTDRFLHKFLEAIHEESIHHQTKVMNAEKLKNS